MRIEISQVITQIISFLIMLWVLKRFAWKPLLKALEDRRNRIKNEFDEIDQKKKELDDLKEQYQSKLNNINEEANAKMKEAIDKGTKISQEIQEDARAQAKNILIKAQENLQSEIYKAKKQLKDELVNMTLAATEKILQTKIEPEKQRSLILDAIGKFEKQE